MGVNEQFLNERVVVSRDVCHGKPRIVGTRIMVHEILDLLASGKSLAEITSDDYYPDLTGEDVLACIAYASVIVQNDAIVPTI